MGGDRVHTACGQALAKIGHRSVAGKRGCDINRALVEHRWQPEYWRAVGPAGPSSSRSAGRWPRAGHKYHQPRLPARAAQRGGSAARHAVLGAFIHQSRKAARSSRRRFAQQVAALRVSGLGADGAVRVGIALVYRPPGPVMPANCPGNGARLSPMMERARRALRPTTP